MKQVNTCLLLLCLNSTLAAEGFFVAGSFSRDKVQTETSARQVNTQDSDFYAFRSGIEQTHARYYLEYAHSDLKNSVKVDVLSLNADYLHPINDKLSLIAGGQLAIASSSIMAKHGTEGWGIGARIANQIKLTPRAKIETGYQVTRAYDLQSNKGSEEESIDVIRGPYITFEFNLD